MSLELILLMNIFISAQAAQDPQANLDAKATQTAITDPAVPSASKVEDCKAVLAKPDEAPSKEVKKEDEKEAAIRKIRELAQKIRELEYELNQKTAQRVRVNDRISAIDEQLTYLSMIVATENPGGGWMRVKRTYLTMRAQSPLKDERFHLSQSKDEIQAGIAELDSKLRNARSEKYALERKYPQPVLPSDFRHAPALTEWPDLSQTTITPSASPTTHQSSAAAAPKYDYHKEEEKRRKESLANLLLVAKNHPLAGEELNDKYTLKHLSKVLGGRRYIYLLVGDQWSESIRITIANAISKGYNIVYDADAPHGDKIREAAGAKALGISAITEDFSQGILRIANPYRRMTFFDFEHHIAVASPESPIAIGAVISGHSQLTMFRYSGGNLENISAGLSKWQDHLDATSRSSFGGGFSWFRFDGEEPKDKIKNQDLGIQKYRFYSRPKSTSGSVTFQDHDKPAEDLVVGFSLDKELEGLKNFEVRNLEEDILAYSQAMTLALSSDTKGVVVYGSSSGSSLYEKSVRQVSRAAAGIFGMVMTGGAGGFMRTANIAATEMQVTSIGVPMTGRSTLSSEKKISRDVQSLTIGTVGYEMRIPVLGVNKAVAIIAPGGPGTMRELATWLVQEAHKEEPGLLVFISKAYYGPLVAWFKELPLPDRIKSRISVVDDDDEFFAELLTHQLTTEADILKVKEQMRVLGEIPEPAPTPSATVETKANSPAPTPSPSLGPKAQTTKPPRVATSVPVVIPNQKESETSVPIWPIPESRPQDPDEEIGKTGESK